MRKWLKIAAIVAYIGLIVLFSSPYVLWHFSDHSRPVTAQHSTDDVVRGILMIPTLPLLFLLSTCAPSMSFLTQTIAAPICLGILLWPLVLLGCRPSLLRKPPVAILFIGYTALLLLAMAFSAAVMFVIFSVPYRP
jgi:hypothetical protein